MSAFKNGQRLVWRRVSTRENAVEKVEKKNCTFIRYGFLKDVLAFVQFENTKHARSVHVSELSVE